MELKFRHKGASASSMIRAGIDGQARKQNSHRMINPVGPWTNLIGVLIQLSGAQTKPTGEQTKSASVRRKLYGFPIQ
jgi:hypothetical protein